MHIYIYISIYIYIHIHIYIYIYIHVVYMHAYMYLYLYMYMYVYIYMHISIYINKYIIKYIYIYIHIYMYIYTICISLSLYIYIYIYNSSCYQTQGRAMRDMQRGPDHPEGETISRWCLDLSARAVLRVSPYDTSLRSEFRSQDASEKIQVLQPPPSSAHRVPPRWEVTLSSFHEIVKLSIRYYDYSCE